MAQDITVERLQEQVDSLTHAVEELRGELGAARAWADLTMRSQGRCPACGGGKVLRVSPVWGQQQNPPIRSTPMSLVCRIDSVWKPAVLQGELEALVCRKCGLLELYAMDAATMEADGKVVREIESPDATAGGPYR